eukprot:GHVS01075669.1.p1 GENE.GHVS01075669.1~~GHVS01075669.1.p1  ORF type:complete len:368 (+),score=70.61 GHVS01075669.1:187-1290(+)
MDDASLEYVLLNKREVFVYKIPPRSPQGHRAEDWKECIWRGKLQVVARDTTCCVKLLDINTAKLFAECPVAEHYEQSVERTMDSSRYFVLRVDDGRGRHAFIGMGFESRNDAFDFNCALSDYARRRQVELQGSASDTPSDVPQRDYRLKEGEKIKVELKGLKTKPRSRTQGSPTTTDSPSSLPFPPPIAQSKDAAHFLAVPPPPASKHRAVRREKSPFDESDSAGAVLGDLLATSPRTSHQLQQPTFTGNVEQDLLSLEFSDFQGAPPALETFAAAEVPSVSDPPKAVIPPLASPFLESSTSANTNKKSFEEFSFTSAASLFTSAALVSDSSSSPSLMSTAASCSPDSSVSSGSIASTSNAPHLSAG